MSARSFRLVCAFLAVFVCDYWKAKMLPCYMPNGHTSFTALLSCIGCSTFVPLGRPVVPLWTKNRTSVLILTFISELVANVNLSLTTLIPLHDSWCSSSCHRWRSTIRICEGAICAPLHFRIVLLFYWINTPCVPVQLKTAMQQVILVSSMIINIDKNKMSKLSYKRTYS